jgi:hypothetical protein
VRQSLERVVSSSRRDRDNMLENVSSVCAHIDATRVMAQNAAHDLDGLPIVGGIEIG